MDDVIETILLWVVIIVLIIKISSSDVEERIEENATKYETEIDEYNNNIEEYAEYINSLELEHLEIIMKVIKDQWKEYQYCPEEDLISGYYRLSLQENGYGVCRSFADDFTAKMNAINPEYQAKNLVCYVTNESEKEEINTVDLEREVLKDADEEYNFILKIIVPIIQKKYGNHMVTLMRIPEENYYLIVDPTNLMIGVIKDGDIYMFNSSSFDTIEYIEKGNISTFGKNCVREEDIVYECDDTVSELNNIYGYEMQLEALEELEEIENNENGIQKQLRLN